MDGWIVFPRMQTDLSSALGAFSYPAPLPSLVGYLELTLHNTASGAEGVVQAKAWKSEGARPSWEIAGRCVWLGSTF